MRFLLRPGALGCALVMAMTGAASASEIWVDADPTKGNDRHDGSQANPVRSFARAIELANATPSQETVLVKLLPGTHDVVAQGKAEDYAYGVYGVLLTHDRVTIEGATESEARFDANGFFAGFDAASEVRVRASKTYGWDHGLPVLILVLGSNVTITGLVVDGGTDYFGPIGIMFWRPEDTVIKNASVKLNDMSNAVFGVALVNVEDGTIEKNRIHRCHAGIVAWPSVVAIEDNDISETNGAIGLYVMQELRFPVLLDPARVTVTHNRLTDSRRVDGIAGAIGFVFGDPFSFPDSAGTRLFARVSHNLLAGNESVFVSRDQTCQNLGCDPCLPRDHSETVVLAAHDNQIAAGDAPGFFTFDRYDGACQVDHRTVVLDDEQCELEGAQYDNESGHDGHVIWNGVAQPYTDGADYGSLTGCVAE